ncbi:Asp/Glu racemase [Aestuarium zhoushanense]|nr:Asp/Glu racemase [Aestuarium zhoushanense]
MTTYPYDLTGPIGSTAILGLIALSTDETVEQDFWHMFPQRDVAVYISRVAAGAELNPDTIATMAGHITGAASLFPTSLDFDTISYACTSGTTLIGEDRVADLVAEGAKTRNVTNPLTASVAALRALGATRLGVVSPYIATVADAIRDAFVARGIEVPKTLSFGEELEARVARIDPKSIQAAALEIGRDPEVDAVFLSCTNLRTMDIIDALEDELGKPVVSSNQALAWHMAQLAGCKAGPNAPGKLFRL